MVNIRYFLIAAAFTAAAPNPYARVTDIRIVDDPEEVYGCESEEVLDPYAQVTVIEIVDDPEEVLEVVKPEYIEILDESQVKNVIMPMEELNGVDDQGFDTVKEVVIVREDPVEPTKPERIFVAVEQPGEFPGGQAAMMKWISNNLIYPESAKKKGISGRVVVKFVVEKDGTISNPIIVRSVDPELDKEALRIINSMPAWTPGKMNGTPVRSYFNLPVTFRITNE